MRIVQFETQAGRHLGVVVDDSVYDITALQPAIARLTDAFDLAQLSGLTLTAYLQPLADAAEVKHSYPELLHNRDLDAGPVLRPPLDHADPHRVLVTGTGLTHLGGMQSRDQMHAAGLLAEPLTDSRKMFELGLREGKPASGFLLAPNRNVPTLSSLEVSP